MRNALIAATIAGCTFIPAVCVHAATPLVATRNHVSLEAAQAMTTAAVAHARQKGISVAIVVVDADGDPVMVTRMDGTIPAIAEVARKKAKTSVILQTASSEVAKWTVEAKVGLGSVEDTVPFGGGAPILHEGKVIGAIGVSGAATPDDIATVEAALAVITP